MPAIRPECPAAREELVDVARDTRFEAMNARSEGTTLCRFADEMDMVGLHGVVDDAEAVRRLASGAGDGDADRREEDLGAERTEGRSERDVNRVAEVVLGATAMRGLRMRTRFATGAFASATPASGLWK